MKARSRKEGPPWLPAWFQTYRVHMITAVVMLCVGLGYWTWERLQEQDGSRFCELPPEQYRYVQVYRKHDVLSTNMYIGAVNRDAMSDAVAAHAASEAVVMPESKFHKFYLEVICSGFEPGDCEGLVVDVGAHFGTHALFLAQLGYEVHAFEPVKQNADLLRCSTAANGLTNMRVVQEGVSDENAIECMQQPLADADHTAMFLAKGKGSVKCTEDTAVQMVTLDHYWEYVLEKRPIHLIKVDVEGHENYVLQGAAKLFAESPPRFILIEYYPQIMTQKGQSLVAYFKTIYGAGYRAYDCQQKVEVPDNASGQELMKVYSGSNLATDLLLVRTSDFPLGVNLPTWQCGY